MNDPLDEASLLIDEAVKRLRPWQRTFTEQEALAAVWDAGHDIPIQSDPRFVLAQEGDGKHPRHWRLDSHTLANNRLLNDLLAGKWDGRDLEGKLAALDAEDQRHYVYCPTDPRLERNKQGILEPAERERNVILPHAMKAELDTLEPLLLERWPAAGPEPWTVRSITGALNQLGWHDADRPNAWLYVRAWLLGRPQVTRVGQDYWMPADHLPQNTRRTRLQVMPVRTPGNAAAEDRATPEDFDPSSGRAALSKGDENQVVLGGAATAPQATWPVKLRTINLLEGFLHVPSSARGVYPPPAPGESNMVVLRGIWFEDSAHCWLWLDREKHRLYGPDLAEKLAWLEAGDIVRVVWAPDIIVIRIAGHDEEVQGEESRLVDLEELAAMRGGLGESYRRSLQAILQEAPEGLIFAEIVKALRERQQHEIHRGTIRALLYSGGFVRKDHRWFPASDTRAAARQLRAALLETLVQGEQAESTQPLSSSDHQRTRIRAIHKRLAEIVNVLR